MQDLIDMMIKLGTQHVGVPCCKEEKRTKSTRRRKRLRIDYSGGM